VREGGGKEREREREGEKPHRVSSRSLSTSITRRSRREGKGGTKGKEERRKGRIGARAKRSATHRRPRNCLRFCFTSRGYLSIAFIDFSHSPSPSLARGPSVSTHTHTHVRTMRTTQCVRKNAKWPEIFVCVSLKVRSLCSYSLPLLLRSIPKGCCSCSS